jgi:hypothetical protein
MSLYPLKFKPRYVQKMWGGSKIETILGKPLPPGPIGESWELYDFPPAWSMDRPIGSAAKSPNGPLAGKTLHELVGRIWPRSARRRPPRRAARPVSDPHQISRRPRRSVGSGASRRGLRPRESRRASEERGMVHRAGRSRLASAERLEARRHPRISPRPSPVAPSKQRSIQSPSNSAIASISPAAPFTPWAPASSPPRFKPPATRPTAYSISIASTHPPENSERCTSSKR